MNWPSPAGIVDGDTEEIMGVVLEFEFELPQPPQTMRQTARNIPGSTNLRRIPSPPMVLL
ncbi:MAG: hypothetical protein ACRD33_06445 [Candidatus Acidiferrales bacterium]